MRQIRLFGDRWRLWRLNPSVVVDEKGEFLRYAEPGEVLVEGEKTQSCRTLIRREIKNECGADAKIQMPNGRFAGTTREPGAPGTGVSSGGAVSPDNCQCRRYAGTKAGEHHPICANRMAWEARKRNAVQMKIVSLPGAARPQHMPAPSARGALPAPLPNPKLAGSKPAVGRPAMARHRPVSAAPVLPANVESPERCLCSKWLAPPKTEGDQHNPMCQHYEVWKRAHPSKPVATAEVVVESTPEGFWLVDPVSEKRLRPVSEDELKAAQEQPIPSLVIDGKEYMVMP